jgi:hypothetical protein
MGREWGNLVATYYSTKLQSIMNMDSEKKKKKGKMKW